MPGRTRAPISPTASCCAVWTRICSRRCRPRCASPRFGEKMIRAHVEDAKGCSPRRSRITAWRGPSIAVGAKVQIQAYFSAIVQNLKRLVALIYYWLVACWLRKQTRPACSPKLMISVTDFFNRPHAFVGTSRNRPNSGTARASRKAMPYGTVAESRKCNRIPRMIYGCQFWAFWPAASPGNEAILGCQFGTIWP